MRFRVMTQICRHVIYMQEKAKTAVPHVQAYTWIRSVNKKKPLMYKQWRRKKTAEGYFSTNILQCRCTKVFLAGVLSPGTSQTCYV